MSTRTIAIRLKIPDNEAFTALSALQRLQIPVARLERSDLWVFETGKADGLLDSVKANETLFNPNKHELAVRDQNAPAAGEVWVEELGEDPGMRARLGGKVIPGVTSAKRFVAWRLFGADGAPLPVQGVQAAVNALLCNPAIERAVFS